MMTTSLAPLTSPVIDVHIGPNEIAAGLAGDVLRGLTAQPRTLPPKWLYDDRGSELFDAITRLPEYYPTECERRILVDNAPLIARRSAADTMIELGSGTSDKTRALLDAFTTTGELQRFVPFDVSEATLRWAAAVLAESYPDIEIHGVVGDYERHLGELPTGGRRMVAFLGGTIGNLRAAERHTFLSDLAATMRPGDSLLLGTDLVKDAARLVVAYDDPQGVTAQFNLNVLSVINRELDADFDLSAFRHEARWNAAAEWVEMHLVAAGQQTVNVREIALTLDFADGDSIWTEISTKFRRQRVADELAAAGFDVAEWMTDPAGDFAVSLSFRR
jgi:L-histidine Nalpha-methyltransferase